MGGYLSTSETFTVKDTCYHKDFYNDTATASAIITAGTGDTASWSIIVTTSDWNYIQIYLKINGTVVLNKKDTSGKKKYTYSGYAAISGDNVDIRLGVGCSQYTESTMTFTTGTLKRNKGTEEWTEVGTGSTTITDNGNNTFTISSVEGASGINNPAYVAGTYWGYDTNYSNEYIGKVNLTISGTGNTRTVYAKSITKGDYGSSKTATTSLAVKQYFIPLKPGEPKRSNKSRLTIKKNWTFSWTASKTSNATTSPISGYKIFLYKNSTPLSGIQIDSNNKLTKGTGSAIYVEKNVTKVTVDPGSFGFKVKDKVKIGIVPYSIWGDGKKHYYSSIVFSAEETVQNAGIVYVRVSDSWKEGQVYVYENNKWNEAEVVQTRISDTWKESQ